MARGFGARENGARTSLPASFAYKSDLKPDDEFGYKLGRLMSNDRGVENVLRQIENDFKALEEQAKKVMGSLSAESRAAAERLLSTAKFSIGEIKEQAETMESINGRNSDTPPDETDDWQDAETTAQYTYEEYLEERDEIMEYLTSKTIRATPLFDVGAKGNQSLMDFLTKAGEEGYDKIKEAYEDLEHKIDVEADGHDDPESYTFGVRLKPVEIAFAGHKYEIDFNYGEQFTYELLDDESREHRPWDAPERGDFDGFIKNWVKLNYIGPKK